MEAPISVTGGAGPAQAAPDLSFSVEQIEPLERAASPTLAFTVRILRASGAPVRSVALNVQIRIAATQRAYDAETRERLSEVFGSGDAWGRNLHSLPWANVTVNVPPFGEETLVELHVPCTYDFEVAVSKYLHGVREGAVPVELLFSGSVFYEGADGGLQVSLVSWEKEAHYRMPSAVWRELMDHYYPGGAWLRLGAESFDRLHAFRSRRALPSWDRTIEALLDEAEDA